MSYHFEQIIGHKKQLDYLKKVIENGLAAHAYCFSGPAQIGKYTIARLFAAGILGIEESQLEIHPNVSIIDDSANISVEQVRDLRERMALSTIGGGKKVAIINSAHKMTIAAQNALLKTLEEPSGNALIILVTQNPQELLSTIRSRTAHLKFNLVSSGEIGNEMAEICIGRPGLAIKLRDDDFRENFFELKKQAEQFLGMSLAGRLTFIESLVKQKEEKDDKIKELIILWRVLIHQKFLQSLAGEAHQNGCHSSGYAAALVALSETEASLSSNSNKSLALQHFALSF